MTVGRVERRFSSTALHDMLAGETMVGVEHRRRNGLGNIFMGLSERDISELQSPMKRKNSRSLSCPCSEYDETVHKREWRKRNTSSRRSRHAEHINQRRMALADIFSGVSNETVKTFLHRNTESRITNDRDLSEFGSTDEELLTASGPLCHRRLALADVFAGIPSEKVRELYFTALISNCSNNDTFSQDNAVTNLPYNKQRRCALGNIFAGIPQTEINELRCAVHKFLSSSIPDMEDTELRCRAMFCRRRFALGVIFADIQKETVGELNDNSEHACDSCLTFLSGCPCSIEETVVNDNDDIAMPSKVELERRRCALWDIFTGIPTEELAKLGIEDQNSNNEEYLREETNRFSLIMKSDSFSLEGIEAGNESRTRDQDNCRDRESDKTNTTFNDCHSDAIDELFNTLLGQQQRKRPRQIVRAMSVPCYSQYEKALQLSADRRRNGQWDVLGDINIHDVCSLREQYVSNVIFASC